MAKINHWMAYWFFLWMAVLLSLAGWWLYLILSLGEKLQKNFASMAIWEGGLFFIILLFLSVKLFLLYLKDQRQTHAWRVFFASLTHELKTPLASIRLQADAIASKMDSLPDQSMKKLTSRLIEDAKGLETRMDKILQLSRIEQGGELNLTLVDLRKFIKQSAARWGEDLKISFFGIQSECSVLADEFALELILRNLMENTRQHAKSRHVEIEFIEKDKFIRLQYRDHGIFKGDKNRLGTLFYKHQSGKGSGIGLYLVKRLIQKMEGHLDFMYTPRLAFNLDFKNEKFH